MKQAELYFKNQAKSKQGIFDVVKETKNFLWLKNEYYLPTFKVSKKSYRVWAIFPEYIKETANANYLRF